MIQCHIKKLRSDLALVVIWSDSKPANYRRLVLRNKVDEFGSEMSAIIDPSEVPMLKKVCEKLSYVIGINAAEKSSELPGMNMNVKHPVTNKDGQLKSVIMDLNDCHGWSREKIADWIETFDEIPTFELKTSGKEKIIGY